MFIYLDFMGFIQNSVTYKSFFKILICKKNRHKFLFILSPPYCGSTLLNEILCTSRNVSVNNKEGTREGQGVPAVRDIMFNHNRRWDETLDFDWEFIKTEWMKCWDMNAKVLLEKSPPNIIRARSINKSFHPSYFIILYRNPYAHVESLMRRENWLPERAAEFAIRCLYYQKRNIEFFSDAILISYEELTKNPNVFLQRIVNVLPELSDIIIDKKFSAHNFKNENLEITNLNIEKISKLSPDNLDRINSVFKMNYELLTFFKYEIIDVSIT
jgi:hypothetical protein